MNKKLLALALSMHLLLSTSPAAYAEEEVPADEQTQETTTPTDPAPEGKSPATEPPAPVDNSEDPYSYNKKKTDTTDTTQKEGGTTWENGYTPATCPANMLCDGAPTQSTSDWQNILTMIGILFGDAGSSSSNDGGTGYAGNSGYDTIGTPTLDTDNTSTVDMPQGDFSTVTPTGESDPAWSDVPTGPDLSGIQLGILGGIPISANASFTYSYVGPGSFKISPMVNPLNPEIDQSTLFTVLVTPTKSSVHVSPPSQSATETYTKGGMYSKIFKFTTMEYTGNSKPRYGQLNVKINVNVYEGSTALCSSDDSDCNNGLVNGDEFGNLPTTGTNTTNTGSSDIGNGFSGLTGNSNGSDLLDNIFSGSGSSGSSNNASNPAWLEDGFSNIVSNGGNGDTMGDVPSDFGSQFATDNNATVSGTDGTITDRNPNNYTTSGQSYSDGGNASNTGDSGSYSTTPTASVTAENPADSTLGSIFAKVDTAIGNDPASANSLTSKFAALTNKTSSAIESATGFKLKDDTNSKIPGSERGSSTDTTAELRELANRMLSANGMSADDIKKGKMYDQGSAYTDPQDAWNLNRMSAAKAKTQVKTTSINSKTTTIE